MQIYPINIIKEKINIIHKNITQNIKTVKISKLT